MLACCVGSLAWPLRPGRKGFKVSSDSLTSAQRGIRGSQFEWIFYIMHVSGRIDSCGLAKGEIQSGQLSVSKVMIEKLPELVNNDAALVRRGRWLNDVFMVEVGPVQYLVHVQAGRIERVETGPFVMPSWTFAVRGPEAMWHRFWRATPAPGDNDLFALRKTGEMSVEGNLQPFMANLIYIKQVLASPRQLDTTG